MTDKEKFALKAVLKCAQNDMERYPQGGIYINYKTGENITFNEAFCIVAGMLGDKNNEI